MSIRTWVIALVFGIGLSSAVDAQPEDPLIKNLGNKVWQVRYARDDMQNKLECGALRLKITDFVPGSGSEPGIASGKLYIFDFSEDGSEYVLRETVSVTGKVRKHGANPHGRVTFEKDNATDGWPWMIWGTYFTGKGGRGNRLDDTFVLRFRPIRAKGIKPIGDDGCDEAPDEDVLEEVGPVPEAELPSPPELPM